MMEQIDRDVMRTHPGLHFFSGDDGSAVTHREVPLSGHSAPPPQSSMQLPLKVLVSLCEGRSFGTATDSQECIEVLPMIGF